MEDNNLDNCEYLLALCRDQKSQMYAKYFINNTSMAIDILVENPPLSKMGSNPTIDEIDNELLKSCEWVFIHKNIAPKSYVELCVRYFDWEFDWSIETTLFLRTEEIEKHLNFKMPIYFIAYKEQPVPILNTLGHICLPS